MQTKQFRGLAWVLMILLLAGWSVRAAVPDPQLVGTWQGHSRFTGISYEEYTTNKVAETTVELTLIITPDGKVAGKFGGAKLTGCEVTANRGWVGRHLHLWTDFIIRGRLEGAIAPGSQGGSHEISIPFNSEHNALDGSVFRQQPWRYPYPFLNLKLERLSPERAGKKRDTL